MIHLRRIGSNHRLICVCTRAQELSKVKRPFRFIIAWLEHDKLDLVLNNSWSLAGGVVTNIDNFNSKVKDWNVSSFGHIGKKKRELMARLKEIENSLDKYPSKFLLKLEKQLKTDLEMVLTQKASLWQQKAHCKWMCDGDRNTKFFHASTIIRRKSGLINMLKLRDDSRCNDPEVLQQIATEFYKDLFTKERPMDFGHIQQGLFYKMTKVEFDSLKANITNEEIHKAVLEMDPLKVLGIDRIHALFYQKKWDVVGQSVCDFV